MLSLFPGHRLKVRGQRFKRDLRGNLFTQGVAHIWNELPEETIEQELLELLKFIWIDVWIHRNIENRCRSRPFGPSSQVMYIWAIGSCTGYVLLWKSRNIWAQVLHVFVASGWWSCWFTGDVAKWWVGGFISWCGRVSRPADVYMFTSHSLCTKEPEIKGLLSSCCNHRLMWNAHLERINTG